MKTLLLITSLLFLGNLATAQTKKGYDKIERYKDGIALVHKDGYVGMIDQDGMEIIPPWYDYIGSFNAHGWAEVRLNGRVGFIDKSGIEVVRVKYDRIGKFDRNGQAQVYRDGKCGIIDADGMEIVKAN